MNKGTSLDKRMKTYEAVTDIRLTRRTPVIMRFDGCHFHTFTRGLAKPFDKIFMEAMQNTMKNLCEDIQGAVFGYTQSDEITLILVDYAKLESDAWFDNRLSKMCSVGASKASRLFNLNFKRVAMREHVDGGMHDSDYFNYAAKFDKADFDCRVFNIPKEEVCNCIIWRQKDAERNSVQALAQTLYHQSELDGVAINKLRTRMIIDKNVDWNDLPVACKIGSACRKNEYDRWYIDDNMPIISNQRDYVEETVFIGNN